MSMFPERRRLGSYRIARLSGEVGMEPGTKCWSVTLKTLRPDYARNQETDFDQTFSLTQLATPAPAPSPQGASPNGTFPCKALCPSSARAVKGEKDWL